MRQLAIRATRVLRRRAARAVRRHKRAHGLILTYHRIAPGDDPDPWDLRVSPSHFREHLEVLARVADVVPLQTIRGSMRSGRRPRPVVALTFDDGYADNLHSALPVLESFGVPATIFVATAWLGRNERFWWDGLAAAILGTPRLPRQLDIRVGSADIRWRAAADDRSSGDVSTADRKALLFDLRDRLRVMTDATRRPACEAIAAWAGQPLITDDLARPMTEHELRRVHASGLIEVGAHTMTHCSLPARAPADQASEIVGSRLACEQILGIPPASFAYPYGEHDSLTARLVAEAGFLLACTNEQELAWAHGDPMRTPRFVALDWDGDRFERRLRREWLP